MSSGPPLRGPLGLTLFRRLNVFLAPTPLLNTSRVVFLAVPCAIMPTRYTKKLTEIGVSPMPTQSVITPLVYQAALL